MIRWTILSAAVATAAFAAQPAGPTPELLAKGKTLFVNTCAPCHGEKGDGTGPAAVALNPKPRNYHTDEFKQGAQPEDIFKTATSGVPGTLMVGFPSVPEDDRWAIAYFVADLAKDNPHLKPPEPAAKPAPAKGKAKK